MRNRILTPQQHAVLRVITQAQRFFRNGPGLSPVERAVFMYVATEDEACLTDVSDVVHMDLAAASKICRGLENRGLIKIQPCPYDRRKRLLTLTTRGKNLITKLLAACVEGMTSGGRAASRSSSSAA